MMLTCKLTGGGTVEWVKNDEYSVVSHNGTVWLFAINQSHTGEYTCSDRQDSFNYYLTVQGLGVILHVCVSV